MLVYVKYTKEHECTCKFCRLQNNDVLQRGLTIPIPLTPPSSKKTTPNYQSFPLIKLECFYAARSTQNLIKKWWKVLFVDNLIVSSCLQREPFITLWPQEQLRNLFIKLWIACFQHWVHYKLKCIPHNQQTVNDVISTRRLHMGN